MRRYPILHSNGEYIPFDMMMEHEQQARRNHGQSIEQLAKRGGTNWVETLCIIKDESSAFMLSMKQQEIDKAIPKVRKFVMYKAYEWLMQHNQGD